MRILTITSLFPNSVEPGHGIFIYNRLAYLAARGVEVKVIAPVPHVPRLFARKWGRFANVPPSELFGKLEVHHPRYALVPRISMPFHGALMYLGIRELVRKLHQEKPFDCIDGHYIYPDCFAAVLAAQALRIPAVVSARGTDINLFPSFRTIRPMIRWTLQHSDGIISVSRALKEKIHQLDIPESKIRVIGNGVDTQNFRAIERSRARKELKIPENSKVVVSVATLRESKGHQHVVAALPKLIRKYPELKLCIVGDGPYRNRITSLIQRSGLQEHVFLAGKRATAEIPFWFNAADVSVLASSSEGWPNVVLESLACGTPVVATPVGQIPELLQDRDVGILTSPEPEDLVAALDTALSRDWDRSALASYAARRPWSRVAEEMQTYLEEIICKPAGR